MWLRETVNERVGDDHWRKEVQATETPRCQMIGEGARPSSLREIAELGGSRNKLINYKLKRLLMKMYVLLKSTKIKILDPNSKI